MSLLASLLPGLLLGTAALMLHLALTLAVAPLLTPLADGVAGLVSGRRRTGPGLLAEMARSWRSLLALMRKQPVRAGGGSRLSALLPSLSLSAALSAAAFVPSFASGLPTAPWADLLTVLLLLASGRVALLLGAWDAGVAAPGLGAVSATVGLLFAVPGASLGVVALSSAAGGTALPRLLSGLPSGAGLLPGACLGLAALSAGGGEAALSEQLSGPDLSLFRLQSMVQAVVWIDLLTALLLPGTVAVAQSGPLHWLLGLSFWALRLLAGGVVLGGVRGLAATATARRRLAGLSVLLGLLAPLLFLVGHRAG